MNMIMKVTKTGLIGLFLFFVASLEAVERVEPVPFGDFETWTVRYIKESKLIGGNMRTLYAIAPTDTIHGNKP